MAEIVRVLKLGRSLVMTIPVGLCRELSIVRRSYVLVKRGQGRRFIVEPHDVSYANSVDRDQRTAR